MPRNHHHRAPEKAPSQRQLRAGELIRHALAEILTRGEVHDPVIENHVITVPEVRVTPDLRLATVYVMPLGGRDESEVHGWVVLDKPVGTLLCCSSTSNNVTPSRRP